MYTLLLLLQATAARWDAQRRADADQAVQQALNNWQALQQQQRQQQQEQWLEGTGQDAELWNAPHAADIQHDSRLQQEQAWQQQQQQQGPQSTR
jgi:hypothetical protein